MTINLTSPPVTTPPIAPIHASHPAPSSLWDLFWSFTLLALQGFGGVLPIVQRELVENKKWLTPAEFVEEWAVAQIMPGPNVVNLSLMVGARYFGLRGALAALAGILAIPLVLVLILGIIYSHFSVHSGVTGAIRGMSAVAAGLIIASALKLTSGLREHPLGRTMCTLIVAVCFVIIALLHWPLLVVLFGIGPVVCGLTYKALRK